MKAKEFFLIWEDKEGNNLDLTKIWAFSLKEAKEIAKKKKAESMLNDLYKIKVEKI